MQPSDGLINNELHDIDINKITKKQQYINSNNKYYKYKEARRYENCMAVSVYTIFNEKRIDDNLIKALVMLLSPALETKFNEKIIKMIEENNYISISKMLFVSMYIHSIIVENDYTRELYDYHNKEIKRYLRIPKKYINDQNSDNLQSESEEPRVHGHLPDAAIQTVEYRPTRDLENEYFVTAKSLNRDILRTIIDINLYDKINNFCKRLHMKCISIDKI
jgi:hypothetical protein